MSRCCPVCHSKVASSFLSVKDVPVHCNVIFNRRDEALNGVKGDIDLTLCEQCGHVFNTAFNPDLMQYSGNYENSLDYSLTFKDYRNWLADQLIERYDLTDKIITEIGCGQGDFLKLLCKKGGNNGIGFDPSYRDDLDTGRSNQVVNIVKDFYSDQLSATQTDFIICRHVLEHIYNPCNFLDMIYRSLDENQVTNLFFEVPNLFWTLCDLSIWDIIYEHYSYFSPYSLGQLFVRCGFSINTIYETYETQFLCIEASKSAHTNGHISLDRKYATDLITHTVDFNQRFREKVNLAKISLTKSMQNQSKVVLWGAGSKGVTFLNILNVGDQIQYVVDINPRKQGKYVAGTGQKIIDPSVLKVYKPDQIIVMNPIYLKEIKEYVRQELNLTSELVTV